MSGVAGRSGRRSTSDEEKRRRIIDKAWDIIELQFDSSDISLKVKAELASKLVTKDMPTQVEGDLALKVTMMESIEVENRVKEYEFG